MRLWSLHPRYLDRQGLLVWWRESLLAQKVLRGETKGYRHHPQLERFRDRPDPLVAISAYLSALADEAGARGYTFDRSRIGSAGPTTKIPVSGGQIAFEWQHLKAKLERRDPGRQEKFAGMQEPEAHPSFVIVAGNVEDWEKAARTGPIKNGDFRNPPIVVS